MKGLIFIWSKANFNNLSDKEYAVRQGWYFDSERDLSAIS